MSTELVRNRDHVKVMRDREGENRWNVRMCERERDGEMKSVRMADASSSTSRSVVEDNTQQC